MTSAVGDVVSHVAGSNNIFTLECCHGFNSTLFSLTKKSFLSGLAQGIELGENTLKGTFTVLTTIYDACVISLLKLNDGAFSKLINFYDETFIYSFLLKNLYRQT